MERSEIRDLAMNPDCASLHRGYAERKNRRRGAGLCRRLASSDYRFLFAAPAALLAASLTASLASPIACWPLPLTSWTAPSPCRRSEPVASPTPCLALPMASLAAPLTLSAVLPIWNSPLSGETSRDKSRGGQMFRAWVVCDCVPAYFERIDGGNPMTDSHADAHDDRWKHDGVRVIPGNQLDPNVPSTPGMDRKAAINFARAGAQKLWAGTVTIRPDAKTGAHHHGHLESIIYVVKGRARMRWGEHLQFTAEANPGDFIFVPPYVPHQEINASPDEVLECVLVRSDGEAVAINLDIEPVEKPETVLWVDPVHPAPK